MRRCLIGVVVAIVVAGSVAFGQGNGRTTHDRSVTPMDIFVGSCFGGPGSGGFDVRNKFTMWLDTITLYDKQGQMTKQEVLVKMDPTIYYNSEDPDKFLESPAENQKMSFVYHEDGSATGQLTGLSSKVVVPGYGPVFMETGHLTYKVVVGNFELVRNTGHNDGVDGDVEALCNFLK